VENPDLVLRPGMTATADITVLTVKDALMVANAALRFTPSASAPQPTEKRGLLDSLLPRPPQRHKAKTATGETTGDSRQGQDRVWVLQDTRPVPVAVEKIATDGAMTAVRSSNLHPGQELIVNAVTADK
jgi:HlyD family secretion protein